MNEKELAERINMLEDVFNKYAKEMAPKYRVKPEWFQIHILPDAVHETELVAGPVVHIRTRILPIHPEANSYLRGWLRTVEKIRQPSELTLVNDVYRWNAETRKALKIKGYDPAESPLLPNSQLEVTATVTVTVRDLVSGNVITEVMPEVTANVKLMTEKARVKLSRLASFRNSDTEVEVSETETQNQTAI